MLFVSTFFFFFLVIFGGLCSYNHLSETLLENVINDLIVYVDNVSSFIFIASLNFIIVL